MVGFFLLRNSIFRLHLTEPGGEGEREDDGWGKYSYLKPSASDIWLLLLSPDFRVQPKHEAEENSTRVHGAHRLKDQRNNCLKTALPWRASTTSTLHWDYFISFAEQRTALMKINIMFSPIISNHVMQAKSSHQCRITNFNHLEGEALFWSSSSLQVSQNPSADLRQAEISTFLLYLLPQIHIGCCLCITIFVETPPNPHPP